jgi:hypothetical protein
MIEQKRFSLVKPTITTPFHIDFEWWKQHDNNWKVYLHSCLCKQHQEMFNDIDNDILIDIIDPVTAEIHQVDAIQQNLINHCAQQPDFITDHTTLVDTVFRVFLANTNIAMSPNDLSQKIHRPPETILKTLAGPVVYKGIRPCHIC